jgi:hypothetical protein
MIPGASNENICTETTVSVPLILVIHCKGKYFVLNTKLLNYFLCSNLIINFF